MKTMDKDFWLGLIGGVFGILGAIAAFVIGATGEALTGSSEGLYAQGGVALIFSIVGIVAPAILDTKKWTGVLMIVSGIIVLIAIGLFGVLTVILFIIGGAVALKNRESENRRQSSRPSKSSSGGL